MTSIETSLQAEIDLRLLACLQCFKGTMSPIPTHAPPCLWLGETPGKLVRALLRKCVLIHIGPWTVVQAEVLATFDLGAGPEAAKVAGCRIVGGNVRVGERMRVLRAGDVLHEGVCASLRRQKLEVDRVGRGTECGIVLKGYSDFQPGDVLQCFGIEMVAVTKETATSKASHGLMNHAGANAW